VSPWRNRGRSNYVVMAKLWRVAERCAASQDGLSRARRITIKAAVGAQPQPLSTKGRADRPTANRRAIVRTQRSFERPC
jgi:hypothetical protein